MTDKQRLFVEAYLGKARFNASAAAREAGYLHPMEQGYQLKQHPEIRAAIEERMAAEAVTASEVLQILSEQARGTLRPFIRTRAGGKSIVLDLTTEEAEDNLHLLKKVKTTRTTGGQPGREWEKVQTEFEIHDPQSAAVHLGRHYKLFTDKHEIDLSKLTPEQALAILQAESGADSGDTQE